MPLFVSTSTRVRLESLSAANFVLTELVRVASSTFRPAVFPVIAWQPASETTVNITTTSFLHALILNPLSCPFGLCTATHQKENKQNRDGNTQRPEQYPSHFPCLIYQDLHSHPLIPCRLWAISKSRGWSGLVFVRNAFFPGRRNIVRAGMLEDILRALYFVTVFRVHGNENVSLFDFFLVLLGFILRNTQSD